MVFKFHKFVSSSYSCSFALTPYDLNVLNIYKKKFNEKKKKLKNDKKENNLIMTPKWKTWNFSHVKGMTHSLEKIHELILNYMI
jgi:hypothetical protein